jgi:hypothetical protein
MVTYSWTPPAGNVTTTSTSIDQKNKWGGFAFDPADGSPLQRSGMYGWIDDMKKVMVGFSNDVAGDLQSPANLTLSAWTYTTQSAYYDMCKPSIAVYDGAVVIVQELNNNSDTTENYIELMYNNVYNGSTWRSDAEPFQGLVVSGIFYNINGAQFRNPKVHHFEGRTFFMTVELDGSVASPPTSKDLLIAVTYDGGASWGPSPNEIYFWNLNDSATGPVIAKETTTTSDNMAAWTHIVDATHTEIIYTYLTNIITGTVMERLVPPLPAAGATVDVYNNDRAADNVNGYASRLGPVTCDAFGVFRKKVIGGLEVSDGDDLTIIGSKLSTQQVGFYDVVFDPLDFVNSLDSDIVLNQCYQDLPGFPFYWALDELTNMQTDTGAAVAQMILNYIWWNKTVSPKVVPLKFADQNALKTAFDTSGNGKINGTEMMNGLNANKPAFAKYGYFFDVYHNRTGEPMENHLKRMAIWLQYNVSYSKRVFSPPKNWPAPGHTGSVAEAVPLYGNYNNWTAIRGIYTDINAWIVQPDNNYTYTTDPVTVYGLWVNDPYFDNESTGNPGYYGLPGKTYMTTATFLTKYLPISVYGDKYRGKYIAVVDPIPGLDQNTDIGAPAIVGVEKARFTPAFARLAANAYGRMDKAIGTVAQQAVANILRNNIEDFSLAGQFEHSIISKVVKMPFGYRVTLETISCDTIVDLDRLGTLLSFTNV